MLQKPWKYLGFLVKELCLWEFFSKEVIKTLCQGLAVGMFVLASSAELEYGTYFSTFENRTQST